MKKLLVVLTMICLMAMSVSAWWDTDWLNRYEINATESVGYDRESDPAKIDISAFNCSSADKSDARFVNALGNEVQSYVTVNKELVILPNITANITNEMQGYIYCFNPNATASTTSGGLAVDFQSSETQIVTIAKNNTRFNIIRSLILGGTSDDSFNFLSDSSNSGFNGVKNVPALLDSNCSIMDNSSIYIRLNCTNTDGTAKTNYEFFDNNLLLRVWYEDLGVSALVGMRQNPGNQQSQVLRQMTYSSDGTTWSLVSGNPVTGNIKRSAYAFNRVGQTIGLVTTFDNDTIFPNSGDNTFIMKLRDNYDDPNGCIGGDGEYCNFDKYLNVSSFTYEAKFWEGFGEFTSSAMNELEATKQNPVLYSVGDIEALCFPDWACNLWGDCEVTDTKDCIEAIDNNDCGENYTGNYTEFGTQSCDYCTPSWSCSDLQGECPPSKIKECYAVSDANTCYAQTGLPADEFSGSLGDYNEDCGYESNYLTGDVIDQVPDLLGHVGIELITLMGLLAIIGIVGLVGYKIERFGK